MSSSQWQWKCVSFFKYLMLSSASILFLWQGQTKTVTFEQQEKLEDSLGVLGGVLSSQH